MRYEGYCDPGVLDWSYSPKHGVDEIKTMWEIPRRERGFVSALIEPDIQTCFNNLAEEWSEATWHVSSIEDLTSHPNYRKIVELGWDAVPFLLRDLQQSHRFWFPALGEITKLRPFDPKDAGNIQRMTEAWISWGKKKGLI